MEEFLTGFGFIGKVGVAGRFVEIEGRDLFGNGADQSFAHCQFGDVDGLLIKAPCRKKLQYAFSAQIYRRLRWRVLRR